MILFIFINQEYVIHTIQEKQLRGQKITILPDHWPILCNCLEADLSLILTIQEKNK